MQVFRQLSESRQLGYNLSYFQQLGMTSQAVKSVYIRQYDLRSIASLSNKPSPDSVCLNGTTKVSLFDHVIIQATSSALHF